MKTWVVTGGIASGKSTFCNTVLGAPKPSEVAHFSCDEAAHLLWTEPEISGMIAKALELQSSIYADKVLDRRMVRDLILEDSIKRERLEAVLHPPILKMLSAALVAARKSGGAKVFLAEVPLYYETRPSLPADMVIVVAATRTVQKTRLMKHRDLDALTCERMLDAQLPLEIKTNQADVVVWNDGSPAVLEAQAFELLRQRWDASH